MKTSVVASLLFGSLALAAPLDKRAYATMTHTVIETVLVYTTVWDNEGPAAPSTTPGLFFEKTPSSSASVVPTPSAAAVSSYSSEVSVPTPVIPSPTPEPTPSSTSTPPPQTPTPEPTPSPSPSPTPSPSPSPEPSTSAPPPPASSSSAPAAPVPSQPTTSSGDGTTYTGSLTMNYFGGGNGACGKPVQDTDMAVALSVEGFGDSTYDPQTGNPTNKWCNKKIRITYNGATADAIVMDRCVGCTGIGGLDATPALWQKLTGGIGGASGDRLESGMSFVVVG